MGMHEDLYEAKALDQHFRYFGGPTGNTALFTPQGGSGTTVDVQVFDLPDDADFDGVRFRTRVSQVANPVPADLVTYGGRGYRVRFVSLPHGGSQDLDCELRQKGG